MEWQHHMSPSWELGANLLSVLPTLSLWKVSSFPSFVVSHVVMEVDCSEVVDLWNARPDSRSIVAPILDNVGEIVVSWKSDTGSKGYPLF